MKQSLQLKIGQQLTMTPQLQQAIRLLQLSSLELVQEIQDALDNNPLLEVEEEFSDESADKNNNSNTEPATAKNDDKAPEPIEVDRSEIDSAAALANNDMPDDLATDSTWDDTWTRSEEHTSELQSRPHLV